MFSGGKMTEEEEMRGETDIQSGKHMKPAKNTRSDRTLFVVFEKGLGCTRVRGRGEAWQAQRMRLKNTRLQKLKRASPASRKMEEKLRQRRGAGSKRQRRRLGLRGWS
jgi:hypothetical protein